MVKRKVKKQVKQKQKQKQNVKVSQNVKVVIGDKRKQVRRKAASKPAAKPSIVLNISNPQPLNNPYIEYFKQQLQNQQSIQANTLRQQEILNEREENKASKAGALHKIDQEPNDVAREMRRRAAETRAAVEKATAERNRQEQEVAASLTTPKSNKKRTPKRKTRLRLEDDNVNENPFTNLAEPEEPDADMLNAMEQQRNQMEAAMTKAGAGAGANDDDETEEGVEETKTEIGDWKPSDEEPLGELDAMYNKTPDEIRDYLDKKKITTLRQLAKEYSIPYSRNKTLLGKPELITNFIKYIKSSSPLPRRGRPPKK